MPLRILVVTVALAQAAGCKMVDPQAEGSSPLVPLTASPDAVTLEIFAAPVPMGDPRVAALWSEVNEQPLPPELRRDLALNGIRAGVVGPHVPDSLAEMLKITDERVLERTIVPLETEPGVLLRVLQPRLGHRQELVVQEVRDQVSVLRAMEGSAQGKTYKKAECKLALRAKAEGDTPVTVELVPEVHHGEPKAQATGGDGVIMWKSERSKQVYFDLKMAVPLAAGQMLVITCVPNKPGSIGHAFFADESGEKPMQRLWVIRSAGAGPDRSFIEPAATPIEVSSDTGE
jgi:hypothetical protein